jgi:hypothetical protein
VLQRAPHVLQHAPHVLQHAPHVLQRAPHVLQHAPHVLGVKRLETRVYIRGIILKAVEAEHVRGRPVGVLKRARVAVEAEPARVASGPLKQSPRVWQAGS